MKAKHAKTNFLLQRVALAIGDYEPSHELAWYHAERNGEVAHSENNRTCQVIDTS